MTYELRPSEIISEFTCGGPKKYAYRVDDTVNWSRQTVCKVWGISLKYSALKLVNFDFIRAMILKGDEPTL